MAAATLSLPPQYNAQDFLHLCRDRQSNLLVLLGALLYTWAVQ